MQRIRDDALLFVTVLLAGRRKVELVRERKDQKASQERKMKCQKASRGKRHLRLLSPLPVIKEEL
jgi:hypothetical protein